MDEITSLWQHSLYNAHIDVTRYPVETNRVIFMYKDGAQAFQANDFLLKQERCAEVSVSTVKKQSRESNKQSGDN